MYYLIFIIAVAPIEYSIIGQYTDYATCHAESVFLHAESYWADKWACVQLPTPTKGTGDE